MSSTHSTCLRPLSVLTAEREELAAEMTALLVMITSAARTIERAYAPIAQSPN